ncbi:L-carnitine dehydratase/bile acid-inducible F domain protein [Bordetella holmesii 70147]|nr:L-carnitine dehydratase/bile acid-inducible F domain protein [Bordetella holmesii 70147]
MNVSLFGALMAMQSLEAATALNYRYETRWFERALNFTAQASDGWLTVIGFFRDNPLQLICQGLGIEDLSVTPGWEDKYGQAAGKEEIARMLQPHFLPLTVQQSVEKLQGAGVLAAPILDFDQALAHPQTEANELIATVPVAGQQDMRFVGSPIRLSRTPATIRRGPPTLDADRADVFAEEENA